MRLQSLRAQLIAGLVVIGILSALINSVAQIKIDHHKALGDVENEFDIIGRHSLLQIERAIRQDRFDLLQASLSGIVHLPSIHRAEVYVEDTLVEAIGPVNVPQSHQQRDFSVIVDGQSIQLTVFAFLDAAEQQLYQRTALIILSNSVRTIIAIIFVVIFIDRLFMRHLHTVIEYLRTNAPGTVRQPLNLVRQRYQFDELDQLVGAVNQLHRSVHHYETNIRAEKKRYIALVENNPEAIWRCEITPPLPKTSTAEEQINHLLQHATLVETNSSAREYRKSRGQAQGNPNQLLFINSRLWRSLVESGGQLKDFLSQDATSDRRPQYFSSSVVMVEEDGFFHTVWGITADITSRTQAQKALEEREHELHASQQRLAEAQALAHMGHWDYRTYGDDLSVSSEFARIYGFRPGDPTPTWDMLQARIHSEDLDYVVDALANPESQAIGAEHRIVWPNGEIRHVQAVVRKLIEMGKVVATFGIIIDITDQRRAEEARRISQQALIESEARMAEAQALAHMGHWVLDFTKHEFSCSDEFYRLYGHQPASFKAELDIFNDQIHPDDRPRMQEKFKTVRERAISDTYRIIRPNGDVRFIRGTATPFYSGGRQIERVFGISIDITEQIEAESALKATQELISTAFTASPDGIAFIDAEQLTFITSNPTLHKITGFGDEELKMQPLAILNFQPVQHPQHSGEPESIEVSIVQHREVTDCEYQITNKMGLTLTCLISWRLVTMQGRDRKLVFLRDVTQLRQLEKITEQQNKQLIHADKLASLGTMVAGVAHEINNPNHIIQMNTDLLAGFNRHLVSLLEELPREQRLHSEFNGLSLREIKDTMPELFEDMKSCCRRIDRIIKDLKDFARPRENAQYAPLDLNKVILQCRSLLLPAIEDKQINLEFKLSPLPPVLGDTQQLQQVIINLAMNAFDALSKVTHRVVVVRTNLSLNQQRVECAIEDNGCGVAQEHISQIFDPFFTTKQEMGGTGLGLAISFQLIREHGGMLQVSSPAGKGTTMSFSLPVARR